MRMLSGLNTHVVVTLDKPYEQAVATMELIAMTGKIDLAKVEQIVLSSKSWEEFQAAIVSKIGDCNLMTFTEVDHGALMSLAFKGRKAKLYVIGNPLIARKMLEENMAVGLYVPLRLLIYENSLGNTQVAYDRPSSLLAKFKNKRISTVAEMLDSKLEDLTSRLSA